MDPNIAQKLHNAAEGNDVAELKTILDARPEAVDWGDKNDEAALVTAACNGKADALRFLLKRGADPCRQKGFALTCACYWGHPDAVRILLEAGADKVIKESRRWHGLHAACGWGRYPKLATVKVLIEYGANPTRIFEGKTPIQYAREKNQAAIEDFLKQHIESVRKERS